MDLRILVLAPHGRDALVIGETLGGVGLRTDICADLKALTAALAEGAGAAVLTEEALAAQTTDALVAWLEQQPAWSDFPFVVLVTKQPGPRTKSAAARLQSIGNVILLERPINAETLCSAAQSALRGRRRQYAAQQHLIDQSSSEEKLRFALDAAGLGAWELDLESGRLSASATVKGHFGREAHEPFDYTDVAAAIHPDDAALRKMAVDRAIASGEDLDVEYRVVWPDRSIHWLHVRGRIVPRSGATGAVMSGVTMDISDRKQREQQVRQLNEVLEGRVLDGADQLRESNRRLLLEIKEREQAQEALVQAQKMEAIGQLTGGIAHDFNNLLTAIGGNVDMIERRSTDDRITRMAGSARQAVERATRLTGQLLAFSRSQQLDLQPVHVDRVIREMDDLLKRTLGHTVTVEMRLEAGETMAVADLTQLELAVLNLAINARDAMEEGGVLTIATRVSDEWIENLHPHPHVVIAVSDTGHGIEPELLGKVFDPFFTTKSVGRGTGLGLSQVYGIASQSGGGTRVSSVVGQGTTVEIWLPVDGKSAPRAASPQDEAGAPRGQGERVLVVDDDPDVRQFVVGCLESLGYAVVSADSGVAGLNHLASDAFDMLVVDYAMPGMTGAEMASQAAALAPHLPILLVTGYADAAAIETLAASQTILRKPFKVADIAAAMRRSLDHSLVSA